jgi:hypothetical protein
MAMRRKDPFDRILDSTKVIQRQLDRQEKTIERLMVKLDRQPPRTTRRKATTQDAPDEASAA